MNTENLTEFNKKIEVINKDISRYEDEEKGILYHLNTVNLLCRCDYMELTKEEKAVAEFQMKIEKKDDLNIVDAIKYVPKNEITKVDADKYTIAEKKVKAYQVWNVTNGMGIKQTFNNKEDAMAFVKEANRIILNALV